MRFFTRIGDITPRVAAISIVPPSPGYILEEPQIEDDYRRNYYYWPKVP